MEINKIIILLNIKKNKKIDILDLENELNVPRVIVSEMIRELHDNGYIKIENEIPRVYCDEELYRNKEWYSREKKEVTKAEFNWDYLYIPQEFGKL